MSNYYNPRKVVIGRHWKRPKPRIYECNIRDTERFYQESYKDYLQNKEYAARRASEEREPRYEANRYNSFSRGDSSLCDSSTSRYGDDAPSRSTNSYRSSSVANQNSRGSPEGDLISVEQRLQRLRRLREDLGMPTDSTNESSYKMSSTASSSRINGRQGLPVETNANETSSYTSTRASSRSRGGDIAEARQYSYSNRDEDSSRDIYSDSTTKDTRNERSKPFSSSYSSQTDDYQRPNSMSNKSVSFSTKEDSTSKRYNKYEDDSSTSGPSEYSYKRESRTKAAGSSDSGIQASGAASDNLDMYDDDEFITNLKKKFVSSNEILERIKNMDNDI